MGDVLADDFVMPMVDGDCQMGAMVKTEIDHVKVIAGAAVRVLQPGARKSHSQHDDRVEWVFRGFKVPRRRSLLADLARRFDVVRD
jgi:hypothetical protein